MHGGGPWFGQFAGRDAGPRVKLSSVQWRRIWKYFRPYVVPLVAVIFVIAAVAALNAVQPILIKRIIDTALPHSNIPLLDRLTVIILCLILVSSLLGVLQTYINAWIGEAVMSDLRVELYGHLQQLPIEFFTRTKTGDVMSRMTNDVQQLQSVVTQTYGMTLSNLLTVVSTVITMYIVNAELATVTLIILPIFIIPTRQVGKATFRIRKATQEKIGEMSAHMGETLSLSGAMLIKVFGRQQREVKHFTGLSQDVRRLDLKQALIGRWFFMFIGLITSAGPAIIYFVGGHPWFGPTASIGTMVAFTVFLTRLLQPIGSLAGIGVSIYSSVALFDRLFEYLNMDPAIKDAPQARTLPQIQGHVEFRHVDFSYDSIRPTLRDVSLDARPGQLIALVGPSGAGKSTISYLIARLYDPVGGQVLLDGVDVRDLRLASLADAIGMVTQETFLFHATIEENLRFAKPAATDAEIVAATQAAYIHDFIETLPDRYQTIVGERGHKLSGGEKQRLSIARVILKNPRVVVLDEATSALDSASERAVQEALASLLQGRTAIVIAHRLSTVLSADCIYVIKQGEVAEHGTHLALLQQGGVYKVLFEEQFAKAMEGAQQVPSK